MGDWCGLAFSWDLYNREAALGRRDGEAECLVTTRELVPPKSPRGTVIASGGWELEKGKDRHTWSPLGTEASSVSPGEKKSQHWAKKGLWLERKCNFLSS